MKSGHLDSSQICLYAAMQNDFSPSPSLPAEEGKKRPETVTYLTQFVLFLSVWNGIRLGQAIALRGILQTYAARGGFLYPALSGAVWLIVGLIVAGGLWWGTPWSRKTAAAAAAAYAAWVLLDRLVLQIPHPGWPFVLGFTFLLLILFYIDLFDPRVSEYIQSQSQR